MHRVKQDEARVNAGLGWQENDLVFCTQIGTVLDAANVRRSFRAIIKAAGIEGTWTPRELRQGFVSLLSAHDMPIEAISHVLGHSGTAVTEQVYRKELRPVLLDGAAAIESIFGWEDGPFGSQFGSQDDSEGPPAAPESPSDLGRPYASQYQHPCSAANAFRSLSRSIASFEAEAHHPSRSGARRRAVQVRQVLPGSLCRDRRRTLHGHPDRASSRGRGETLGRDLPEE